MSKVLALGLDGLDPLLVQRWLHELPHLRAMQQDGVWGSLESVEPPDGPQVWLSALCGKNPGAFGIWSEYSREDSSYQWPQRVDSSVMDERIECLHHLLPKMAQRVAMVNVPYSWPPVHIPGGFCVSPRPAAANLQKPDWDASVWPEGLAGEIASALGGYDPAAFAPAGTTDTRQFLERLQKADSLRIALSEWFLRDKNCDVVLTALSGIEWAGGVFCPRSAPSEPRADVLRDCYKWIDTKLGDIRAVVGADIALMAFSPYSVHRSSGTVLLNEWLAANGYLVLREYPARVSPWGSLDVDWARTRCWSAGKAGQLYVNLVGREAEGAVDPAHYDRLLAELSDQLGRLTTEDGADLALRVTRREDIHFGPFAENGPDLFVSFDDYGSDDSVGYGKGQVYRLPEAEEQPRAAHRLRGYFALVGADIPAKGELPDISLLSIAPTVIDILGLKPPPDMERPSILALLPEKKPPAPPDGEQKVRSRLEALGY